MTQERLNGLTTLYTHKYIKIDPKDVVMNFSTKHKRKLKLVNILKTDEVFNQQDDIIQSDIYSDTFVIL